MTLSHLYIESLAVPQSDVREIVAPSIDGSKFNNNLDDRDGGDQDVETVIRMSENYSSTGRKEIVVIRAGEEVKKEALNPPVKKYKSQMHCCEVCLKKFPRCVLFVLCVIASP